MADEPQDDELQLTDDQIIEDDQDDDQKNAQADGDDAEAEETVISFGDEAAPASEGSDSDLVRNLRAKIREKEKELSKFRTNSAPKAIEVGDEPTLESCEWDEQAYKTELLAYEKRKAQAEKQNAAQTEAAEKAQADWQADLGTFAEQKTALRVPDFDDAEAEVETGLSQIQQAVVVKAATNKAAVIYALGKDKARLDALAQIHDPIKLAVAVAKLEGELKVTTRRKAPEPEEIASGNARVSQGSDKTLERLEKEADKSGDRTKLIAYKKSLKSKA